MEDYRTSNIIFGSMNLQITGSLTKSKNNLFSIKKERTKEKEAKRKKFKKNFNKKRKKQRKKHSLLLSPTLSLLFNFLL